MRGPGARTALIVAAIVATATGCDTPREPSRTATATRSPTPSSSPTEVPSLAAVEKPCDWQFGAVGAFGGRYASIGRPLLRGIRLAIRIANADREIPCRLELVEVDSEGDARKAKRALPELLRKKRLIACVCGSFTGDTVPLGRRLSRHGIPFTSTSVDPRVSRFGFDTWFRAVASDDLQSATAVRYIDGYLDPDKVTAVYGDDSYGKAMIRSFARSAGKWLGDVHAFPSGGASLRSLTEAIASEDPDVLFYAGYPEKAARLVTALAEDGSRPKLVATDGTISPDFGAAGDNARGAVATCSCSSATRLPEARAFLELYREEYGEEPGVYSLEVFDITGVFLQALRKVDGNDPVEHVRRKIVTYLSNSRPKRGITKDYLWEANGELRDDPSYVWVYKWSVNANEFVLEGSVDGVLKDAII